MRLKGLYFFTIFFLYIVSMQPWFMWNFPYSIIYLLGAIVSFVFYSSNKNLFTWEKGSRGIFTVFTIGMIWFTLRAPILVGVGNVFTLISFYVFLGLPRSIKHELFIYIKKRLAIILLISLTFYFIHVVGVPLPSVYADYGLYGIDNYFFFVLTNGDLGGFNRFRSIFGEPGFLTLGLIPLFFAGKFNLRDKYTLILLFAELVSLSLAGYAVLIVITLYYSLNGSAYKRYARGFILALLVFISAFAIKNREFFEIIDTNLIARVAIDDNTGNIAGYNRSTQMMDDMFDKLKKTPDVIWGLGESEMNDIREKTGMDEGGGNAGFKIYTYIHGYIGVIIFVLFYYLCFWQNRSRDSLVFYLCILLLLFQNSYVDWYCVLIGSYLCFLELRKKMPPKQLRTGNNLILYG